MTIPHLHLTQAQVFHLHAQAHSPAQAHAPALRSQAVVLHRRVHLSLARPVLSQALAQKAVLHRRSQALQAHNPAHRARALMPCKVNSLCRMKMLVPAISPSAPVLLDGID